MIPVVFGIFSKELPMFHLLLAVIYLAFISLGLPDALLGSAWPTIYQEWSVPVSSAGVIYLIISLGTVVSSLLSDRLTRSLGPGKVTALSVATTALALWGYSVSGSFWQLCLWSVPYGLGAGSVDAALNNYVAIYYASRHMSLRYSAISSLFNSFPQRMHLCSIRSPLWSLFLITHEI